MAKGYWIAFVTVTDAARYAGYQHHAPAAFAKYGAQFLVRVGRTSATMVQAWAEDRAEPPRARYQRYEGPRLGTNQHPHQSGDEHRWPVRADRE